MNKTNRMALQAKAKAEAMGWNVRFILDQSDVLDYATVVAWAPGAQRARYIRFIEELEADKGWVPVTRYQDKLEYCNCY